MKEDSHPFQISTKHNAETGFYDLQLLVGKFESQKEADRYAAGLAAFLSADASAWVARVQ